MPRIANPDNIASLNRVLQRLDKVDKKLLNTNSQLQEVQKRVSTLDALHAPQPTTNNLVFTWTGGSHTLSWPQGDIQDKNAGATPGATGIVHTTPVSAGSATGLVANTHYWLGWSTTQQKMLVVDDAHPVINKNDVRLICRIFTGTAGQTGVAGGGGSQAQRDLSGLTYKNF